MRWLANWLLQDSYLELEGGVTVCYLNEVTGPGHILHGEERNALEGTYAWGAWALFAVFVFPDDFFEAQILPLLGNFVGVSYVASGLWLAPLLVLFVLFSWHADRVLEKSERRDPSKWKADLERLKAARGTREKILLIAPLFGVVAAGIFIGTLLEALLLQMIPA